MIFRVGNTWQSITSQELINLWPSTSKYPQERHFPDQWSKWKSKKRGTCITDYLPREENQPQWPWKLSHIGLMRVLAQPCFFHSAGYLPCSKHLVINTYRKISHIFCCSLLSSGCECDININNTVVCVTWCAPFLLIDFSNLIILWCVFPWGHEAFVSNTDPKIKCGHLFWFFCLKAFSRIIFSFLLRPSNHQIVGKKNKTEFAF